MTEPKTEISALDLRYIVKELEFLKGARVQKFFQNEKDLQIVLHVSGKGTQYLIIGPGKIYLTKHQLAHPDTPTSFAMYLRKYLSGKKIESITQHDFERIVIIEFPEHKLIIELFGTGNAIVTAKDDIIWTAMEKQSWAERKIKQTERYHFPPPRIDFDKLDEKSFSEILKKDGKKIVVVLASNFGLGGTYAEEICLMSNVDKNKVASELNENEIRKLSENVEKINHRETKASIILENGHMVDVVPFTMLKYSNFEAKEFQSYSDALDEYLTKHEDTKTRESEGKESKVAATKLEIRLKQQQDAIKRLSEKEKEEKEKANAIYENYGLFSSLLKLGTDFDKISKIPGVESIDKKTKAVTLNVGGKKITIKLTKTVEQNAALFYESAKKAKAKIKGAEDAMKKTLLEIEKSKLQKENEMTKAASKTTKAPAVKKHWFDSFRWFKTSGDFLVVAGKDAVSNEVLIKKHMETNDLVLHSEISGSPFALLKEGNAKATKNDIQEAATFVACYSRAWKTGVGLIEAYSVTPDQVSKQAPSGEYISRGAFMIYGKKEFYRAELKIAIGFADGTIICGPISTISKKTPKYITIEPGNEKSGELSKHVKAGLFKKCSKDEQEILRKLPISEIQHLIPLGQGQIVR